MDLDNIIYKQIIQLLDDVYKDNLKLEKKERKLKMSKKDEIKRMVEKTVKKQVEKEFSAKIQQQNNEKKILNSRKLLSVLLLFLIKLTSEKYNKLNKNDKLFKIILNLFYKILLKLNLITSELVLNGRTLEEVIKYELPTISSQSLSTLSTKNEKENKEKLLKLFTSLINQFLIIIKLNSLMNNKSLFLLIKFLKDTNFTNKYNSKQLNNSDFSKLKDTLKDVYVSVSSGNVDKDTMKEQLSLMIQFYNSLDYVVPTNDFKLVNDYFSQTNHLKSKLKGLIGDLWSILNSDESDKVKNQKNQKNEKEQKDENESYKQLELEVKLIQNNEIYNRPSTFKFNDFASKVTIPYQKEIAKKFLKSIKHKIPYNRTRESLKSFMNFRSNTFEFNKLNVNSNQLHSSETDYIPESYGEISTLIRTQKEYELTHQKEFEKLNKFILEKLKDDTINIEDIKTSFIIELEKSQVSNEDKKIIINIFDTIINDKHTINKSNTPLSFSSLPKIQVPTLPSLPKIQVPKLPSLPKIPTINSNNRVLNFFRKISGGVYSSYINLINALNYILNAIYYLTEKLTIAIAVLFFIAVFSAFIYGVIETKGALLIFPLMGIVYIMLAKMTILKDNESEQDRMNRESRERQRS